MKKRFSDLFFTRATSQSPCLHETLATAAITSKIREAYFSSFAYTEIQFLQQRYQVLQSGKNSAISSGSGDVNSNETPVTGWVNASR